ncbi:hypothetical protein [Tautonia plasticadhaerens]|uniref:hypothetical protein n=1 Tax=Tautonia plasticadhaerens TaxID=2527974 RepID=UPI0011A32D93|nr:hypothetical protein [Tautonia plasticadhaerens]
MAILFLVIPLNESIAQWIYGCSAINISFTSELGGTTTIQPDGKYTFMGTSSLKFDCASAMSDTCAVCVRFALGRLNPSTGEWDEIVELGNPGTILLTPANCGSANNTRYMITRAINLQANKTYKVALAAYSSINSGFDGHSCEALIPDDTTSVTIEL